MARQIITYLLETPWISVEISNIRFLLYQKVVGQCDPTAVLRITDQGITSKKIFGSKICME